MKIREIILENYQCYYGEKVFEFTDGLNFIIGGNTEGKTKFFEAIDWLLSNEAKSEERLVSAKKLSETEVGGRFSVSVSIIFEHGDNKKIITKSFIVKKTASTNEISKSDYSAIIDDGNDRKPYADPKGLLESIFPSKLRKYSLFKGESDLQLFEEGDAMKNLIEAYSNAKDYDEYVECAKANYEKYSKELIRDSSSNESNKNKIEGKNRLILEDERSLTSETEKLKCFIDTESDLKKKIKKIETSQDQAEQIEFLNEKIKHKELDRRNKEMALKESYQNYLFDKMWIVDKMEKEIKDFRDKITVIDKEKRQLQNDFIRRDTAEKVLTNLSTNDRIPLNIMVPGEELMREMLNEHICKFCNREFNEGDETSVFMNTRLNDYLDYLKPVDSEEKDLFKYNNYAELNYNYTKVKEDFSKRTIQEEIRELLEFNTARRNDVKKIKDEILDLEKEKEDIISRSSNSEIELVNSFKNYKEWHKQLRRVSDDIKDAENRIAERNESLKQHKEDLDKLTSKYSSANGVFLKKARNILEEIVKIFETTRKEKFEEFIKKLEVIANKKFQIISETGFAGTIKLNLLKNGNSYKIEIDLYSINNQVIDCSTSAKTSMYLSVLLAISELTKETQSVKYPLIMDAPISSFDPNKKRQLWKVLNEIDDTQIILVMYEFIDEVGEEKEPILNKKLYSKVAKRNGMFIKIKRPFDKNDLATINTEIHQLD